jgi:predicted XRE-type DNA-binding protein
MKKKRNAKKKRVFHTPPLKVQLEMRRANTRPKATPEQREELIRQLLKIQFENNWTQTEMAKKMHITRFRMNRVLRRKVNITPIVLDRITWFLETYGN